MCTNIDIIARRFNLHLWIFVYSLNFCLEHSDKGYIFDTTDKKINKMCFKKDMQKNHNKKRQVMLMSNQLYKL